MSNTLKIKTVMTIDDNALDQILYSRIMKRSGIVENIISFQLAEDALTYLKSDECEEIDVILLDINMPRMTGFEFLQTAIGELGPNFLNYTIFILTTSLDPFDRKRAKDFDMVKGYLDKPLATDDMENIAHALSAEATRKQA